MKLLEDKTIVIVGGTKGIGKSLVYECLRQGARVVFSGRDKASAEQIQQENLNYTESLHFIAADLNKVRDCQNIFTQAKAKFGALDGYVHYAGITPVASLTDCDEATYDAVMNINLKAAFFCTQAAVQKMQDKGGSIVLVGSAHSWGGQKDRAAYAVSKGGLYTLCQHLAHNYANQQIRCNYLTMGWTATEGELALREAQGISQQELEEQAVNILPMGKMPTANDHLAAFIYFLSDQSSLVTGSNLRVTAGEYI